MTLAQDHLSCIGGEAGEKETEHLVAPAASKLEDTDAKKVAEPFQPPWIVSTAFTKQTSETGVEQFKTPSGYAPTSLKCRGNTKNYAHEDREFMDFKAFDPLFPMKPQKECCEMNAPWEESKKPQPWWQAADADGLASLVAEKAMHNVVTNDLPRPTQTLQVHGEKLMNHPREKDNYEQPFPSVAQELDPLHDTMVCSYGVSSTETNSCEGGSWQPHPRNSIPGVGRDSYSSTNSTSGSKPTYQNSSERATLLDALRHSQTRAREAEMAAKKAYDEKDHVIKLLFRQASHLFACKQWLKMLQLENICLQLRLKEQQIATMFPEFPWMMVKEKAAPAQDQKEGMRKRGRKPNRKGGLHKAAVFVVGVGIVGAGLLLGWTLGWLLPKL
jgi:hypothetical protein